ncbi:hypothetical protein BLOT_007742 [Blomia tropicalis]|nr:hypothetical protein BLOT_007742 [Blomia tropicalis]
MVNDGDDDGGGGGGGNSHHHHRLNRLKFVHIQSNILLIAILLDARPLLFGTIMYAALCYETTVYAADGCPF